MPENKNRKEIIEGQAASELRSSDPYIKNSLERLRGEIKGFKQVDPLGSDALRPTLVGTADKTDDSGRIISKISGFDPQKLPYSDSALGSEIFKARQRKLNKAA